MTSGRIAAPLPPRAGLGLKAEHYRDILDGRPDVGFFEIHAENYMGAGGPPHRYLEAIRRDYPISLHGVGLSIGAARPLDRTHLDRLKRLIDIYEPGLFSEHLAWSTHDSGFLNDLLPVPYTDETLALVAAHVNEVQDHLNRRMLLENPSTYVVFQESTWTEVDFIAEIQRRTGCGLLLDVNNVFVSATNHGYDPEAYLDAFPMHAVEEMHLAGFAEAEDGAGGRLLIDAHGTPTAEAVMDLYAHALRRSGPLPSLVEWDNDVPAFAVLRSEGDRVDAAIANESRRRNSGSPRHVPTDRAGDDHARTA
jgi:uncharacterized protein